MAGAAALKVSFDGGCGLFGGGGERAGNIYFYLAFCYIIFLDFYYYLGASYCYFFYF